jgi:hypothetical protein
MCAHHFVPFYGHGHIAYIPNDKIVGLSKLPRLLEFFARSSAALAFLSGAAIRAGLAPEKGAPYRGDLMTRPVRFRPELHTSELFALLVEALAEPPDTTPAP